MIHDFLLSGTLLMILAAAILVVITDRLLHAVIYAGVLSSTAAFCYLLLGAPDVALAEVVIGSTLSTIVYLVTLKKYRIFTVYYRPSRSGQTDGRLKKLLLFLEQVLEEQELEPHLLPSLEAADQLLKRPECDLAVEPREGRFVVHGEESSRYFQIIKDRMTAAGYMKNVVLEDSIEDRVASYKENLS